MSPRCIALPVTLALTCLALPAQDPAPRYVEWLGYLGGSGEDIGYGAGTDAAGNVYVAGSTSSFDFGADAQAVKIGSSAFNQNCARCHGLGAVSGGIAPDLRYLERGDEMDEFFIGKVRNGVTRNGAVYMPPFEGMLTQEAMWAIRAWLETVHEEQ